MTILLIYVVIFVIAYFAVKAVTARVVRHDFTSLKTVTFGDESAVRPNRAASIISVATIFLIWGAFTGSSWVPIHAPGPFVGDTRLSIRRRAQMGRRIPPRFRRACSRRIPHRTRQRLLQVMGSLKTTRWCLRHGAPS